MCGPSELWIRTRLVVKEGMDWWRRRWWSCSSCLLFPRLQCRFRHHPCRYFRLPCWPPHFVGLHARKWRTLNLNAAVEEVVSWEQLWWTKTHSLMIPSQKQAVRVTTALCWRPSRKNFEKWAHQLRNPQLKEELALVARVAGGWNLHWRHYCLDPVDGVTTLYSPDEIFGSRGQ